MVIGRARSRKRLVSDRSLTVLHMWRTTHPPSDCRTSHQISSTGQNQVEFSGFTVKGVPESWLGSDHLSVAVEGTPVSERNNFMRYGYSPVSLPG